MTKAINIKVIKYTKQVKALCIKERLVDMTVNENLAQKERPNQILRVTAI